MQTKAPLKFLLTALIWAIALSTAQAQEYVTLSKPLLGRSPGVKIKLLSDSRSTRAYVIVFAPGDEIMSGLYEFADKYHVECAHFTALGDVRTAKIGWFDQTRKKFKVNNLNEQCEVTSMTGDIALYNGSPVVHAHINLATQNGIVFGGHLLEGFVTPTLEVFITVEPVSLNKKLNPDFDLPLIDPSQK